MYNIHHIDDSIAAIATAPGGGIGIVRLSGPAVFAVCDQIFRAKNGQNPSSFKGFSAHYGWVVDRKKNSSNASDVIDEALLMIMRAPKSYTCQDMAEISCHGGLVSLRMILELILKFGVRLAEPGEFTKRAFLNGRIDLAQAEAVLDIVQAKTGLSLAESSRQLKGELSSELEGLREKMMTIFTEIEALVNFPEDDIDAIGHESMIKKMEDLCERIKKLLATGEQGRILREGLKVVLCGRPNVGKSSLLNVLLRTPRAIVSDIPGTTRDTIEELAQIRGIPFQVVDTAGILTPRNAIEQESISRSRIAMESADLILWVLDSSQEFSLEDQTFRNNLPNKKVVVVLNKSDLPSRIQKESFLDIPVVSVSALTKAGLADLEKGIVEMVWKDFSKEHHQEILVTNSRHLRSLQQALVAMERGTQLLKDGLVLECVSEDIKEAVNACDAITGRNIDEDLLEQIFSSFCIGK